MGKFKNKFSGANKNQYHKQPKKAQFAMEFILLIGFMLMISVGFFAIVNYKMVEEEEKGKQQAVENIASLIDNEVKLAKSVNDGYKKTFNLPKKIDGNDYGVRIIGNRELIVNTSVYEYILFLPENVIGNVSTGLNEIKKIDNIVQLRYIGG